MAKRDCDREPEILAAVAAGAIGPELRAHAGACGSCGELLAVATAVVDDRASLMRSAALPGAGVMWWRMNLREKREAARAAVRTGSVIQFALVAAALVAAITILGISIDVHAVLQSIAGSARAFALPLIALAAWCVIAPLAVYFAIARDGKVTRGFTRVK